MVTCSYTKRIKKLIFPILSIDFLFSKIYNIINPKEKEDSKYEVQN